MPTSSHHHKGGAEGENHGAGHAGGHDGHDKGHGHACGCGGGKAHAQAGDERREAHECGDACHGKGCDHDDTGGEWRGRSLVLAGVCVAVALAMEWGGLAGPRAVAVAGAAGIAAGGWFLLPGAWRAVRTLRPTITLLTVIATAGAAVIGQWLEAATVVFLFGVAEWLEGWADRRAQRAVRALLELAPEVARVKGEAGEVREEPVEQVAAGTRVLVRSGERVPLDGVVEAGESSVNQAPITGESTPVDKGPGAEVFAGTINGEGALEVRVTKAAGDSVLARIIRLVEEAQERRAPTQRFVDVFATYYTPLVTVLAALVFAGPPLWALLSGAEAAWSVWLYRACVLLIIACPCALVISTPVGIVAGLTALARRGVLVKGGAHLETIARLRALAMDKTGTLTVGEPRVQGVRAAPGVTEAEVLQAAAAIDEHSTHPLALAIVAHAREAGVAWTAASGYRGLAGRGAEGRLGDGRRVFVGNRRLAEERGADSPELKAWLAESEARGGSVVIVGEPAGGAGRGRVLGLVALGDALRPGAREAVAALHAAGVRQVVVLSGDNQRTVDAVAREAGIDEARGDLLPEDKVTGVAELRAAHGVTGMVGDGVNDAPAMAAASVGIAMGAAGSDAAIETADIALMQDDLGRIADAVRVGRKALGVIRFNIAFALGLKAVFLAATLLGHASLWLAILADTGATLLVVANSLRLLRSADRGGEE